MPISAVLHLIPTEDVRLRPTMGHHAHAAFLAIIRESDPALAETLHAQSAQKPFTVSPLIADAKKRDNLLHIRAGTACKLRYTFLDDALFQNFGQTFLTASFPTIRLGNAKFQVKQLVSHATEERSWSGNTTYAELIQSAKTDTWMCFRFYSPTAFRRLTPRGQKTRTDPHLDLERCYQSWVNKWNAFAPIKLNKAEILAFVAEYGQVMTLRTESHALNFGRHTEVGWVGTCACVFYPENSLDERLIRTANCLANFAFYCGTGYKTTMGMGQTRRID